jgi:ribonuclease VapC
MVIDTSALIAILKGEPESVAFKRAIYADPIRLISAVTKLEAGMVAAGRRGQSSGASLDRLLNWISASIVPFDERQADIARDAFARFGKGRHQTALNFGDCAAYALAIAEAEPLLFKGTDFGATDVECVKLDEPRQD